MILFLFILYNLDAKLNDIRIDKIHWNEIHEMTYQWILSFYMTNILDTCTCTLGYCWVFLFSCKRWLRYMFKPQKALNKNCFSYLSFYFTIDAVFFSLLKGITICTYNHLIVHVSAFDRVNSIMFVSPNFLVNKLNSCCFISLKIKLYINSAVIYAQRYDVNCTWYKWKYINKWDKYLYERVT